MNIPKLFLSAFERQLITSSASREIIDGRAVLRGIEAPVPKVVDTITFERWNIGVTSGNTIVRRQSYVDLHFVGCRFSDVKFFNCQFRNCLFEMCSCQKMGFWQSTLKGCTFRQSDLRETALGGDDMFSKNFRANRYEDVVFERCDMRASAHSREIYTGCLFDNCRLDDVLFMGAVLKDCRFVGKLKEVEFRDYDVSRDQEPKNRLEGCDFREADLIGCQFIRIGLDPAMFPQDEDRIVLPNGPEDLRRWKALLGSDNLFLDHVIRLSGAPAIEFRSEFLRAGFTSEQVDLLEEIAAGRH